MVSIKNTKKQNIKFIQGKEFFNSTYTLARANGFRNNEIKLGNMLNEAVLLDCSSKEFDDLCYKAFQASLATDLKKAYAVDMFIRSNIETIGEETLSMLSDDIYEVFTDVSKERSKQLKDLYRSIHKELTDIKKIKKYYKKNK